MPSHLATSALNRLLLQNGWVLPRLALHDEKARAGINASGDIAAERIMQAPRTAGVFA